MKNLLNLGKALNKAEQKSIHGGGKTLCSPNSDCCIIVNPNFQYVYNGIVCIIGSNPSCGFVGIG